MNAVDAAYKVLQEAGKPLHYAEITRRIVRNKFWLTSGRTPENTVTRAGEAGDTRRRAKRGTWTGTMRDMQDCERSPSIAPVSAIRRAV
jgi:hypothetical protein